jgi:hypothetical protein
VVDFAMQFRKGEWIRRFSIIQIYCLALCSYQVCRDYSICIYGKLPYNRLSSNIASWQVDNLPTTRASGLLSVVDE